jgi:hypothetical protein
MYPEHRAAPPSASAAKLIIFPGRWELRIFAAEVRHRADAWARAAIRGLKPSGVAVALRRLAFYPNSHQIGGGM